MTFRLVIDGPPDERGRCLFWLYWGEPLHAQRFFAGPAGLAERLRAQGHVVTVEDDR